MPMLVMRHDFRAPDFGPASAAEIYTAALEQFRWADQQGWDFAVVSEHHGLDDGWLPGADHDGRRHRGHDRTHPDPARARWSSRCTIRCAWPSSSRCSTTRPKGRVWTVAGAGYRPEEFEMAGAELKRRGKLLEEYVGVMLKAWTGEPFEWQGRTITVTPKPFTQPHPTILIGGGVEAAARRAARLRLPMMPMNEDARLAEWYADEAAKTGFEGGFVMAPSGPTFVHVSHDPERAWAEIAPYVLYEAQTYAGFQTGGQHSTPMVDADTLDDLKNSPQYLVGTPGPGRRGRGEGVADGRADVQPAGRVACRRTSRGPASSCSRPRSCPASGRPRSSWPIDPRAPGHRRRRRDHPARDGRRGRRSTRSSSWPRRPNAPVRTAASPECWAGSTSCSRRGAPGRTAIPGRVVAERFGASDARSVVADIGSLQQTLLTRAAQRGRRRRRGRRARRAAPRRSTGRCWRRRPGSSSTTRIRRSTDPDEVLGAGGRHPDPDGDRARARGAGAPVRDRSRARSRTSRGARRSSNVDHAAELWSRFAAVAAENPDAWDRRGLDADAIGTPGPDNRVDRHAVHEAAVLAVERRPGRGHRDDVGRDRGRRSASRPTAWCSRDAAAESNQMVPLPYRAEIHRWPAFEAVVEALGLTGDRSGAARRSSSSTAAFPPAVQVQARALGLPLDAPSRSPAG